MWIKALEILSSSQVLVALITALGTFWVTWLTIKKPETASQTLKPAINIANELYPILWEMLNQFKAKRICVFEFHNGGKYYSGRSIQRVTMSYEVASYEIKRISPEFQGTVMSDAFHIGLKELVEKNMIYYPNVGSLPEMGTKALLMHYGSKAIASYLFCNKQNDPIACITVCFDKNNPLDLIDLELLEVKAKGIEKYLHK